MTTPKCKNPRCEETPKPFKSGKFRTYCCTHCSIQVNNQGRDYSDSKNGVAWEESAGLIKAKMKIARRDRLPYRFRCRTCACPIEHEINMVTEDQHHYCSEGCHKIKLTDEIMARPRAFTQTRVSTNSNARKSEITVFSFPSFYGTQQRGVATSGSKG